MTIILWAFIFFCIAGCGRQPSGGPAASKTLSIGSSSQNSSPKITSPSPSQKVSPAKTKVDEAVELYNLANYKSAEKLLKEALKENPKDLRANYYLHLTYVQIEELPFNSSSKAYKQAALTAKLDPKGTLGQAAAKFVADVDASEKQEKALYGDHLIIPGQRMGVLRLGMSFEQVQKAWGKPDDEKSGRGSRTIHMYQRYGFNLMVDDRSGSIVSIHTVTDKVQTPKGTKVGMSEQELNAREGEGVKEVFPESTVIRYPGMVFYLDSGTSTIVAISIMPNGAK